MYLGGYLASAALTMAALRLGSYIMGRSALVYGLELYGGLLMFSAYILYDTQVGFTSDENIYRVFLKPLTPGCIYYIIPPIYNTFDLELSFPLWRM